MASKLIGRTACPECGFGAAHVKQSEKCVYRYCPECASQHHARTERQRADLLAKTRMVDAPASTPTPTPREPAAAVDVAPAGDAPPTPREPSGTEPSATPAATPGLLGLGTPTARKPSGGWFSFPVGKVAA